MDQRVGQEALAKAIRVLGGQPAVAKVVGVRQQTISACLRNGKRVPAEWCIPLERATEAAGEKISRHELRPDLYPEPPQSVLQEEQAAA